MTEVSAHTGFPEIMDGRVKTLHPKIHGGLLGRRGIDEGVMAEHGIERIDLLVVNLYPFARTVAKPGCSYEDAIENIDIGGPAMVRAASKNHDAVTVVVDPADYATLLRELDAEGGATTPALRARLAAKAFAHTAHYDTMVSGWLLARQDAPPATHARCRGRHAVPRHPAAGVREGARPALRRESAPAGRVLPRPRGARRERRHRDDPAGQGDLVQQHRRCRHGDRMRAAVPGGRLRDRQARQSLRRRGRRHAARMPTSAPGAPIPPRPSAASSPSTASSTAPRQPPSSAGSSSRWSRRRASAPTRAARSRPRRTSGCSSSATSTRRPARAPSTAASRAGCSRRGATSAWWRGPT